MSLIEKMVIVWPEKAGLSDLEAWERNLAIVRWLCWHGDVIEWQEQEDPGDPYQHFPYKYKVMGVEVEFLPHWGFYSVGHLIFDLPTNQREVWVHVQAVKNIAAQFAQMKEAGLRSISEGWCPSVGLRIVKS